jgi:hypothetical protein
MQNFLMDGMLSDDALVVHAGQMNTPSIRAYFLTYENEPSNSILNSD